MHMADTGRSVCIQAAATTVQAILVKPSQKRPCILFRYIAKLHSALHVIIQM